MHPQSQRWCLEKLENWNSRGFAHYPRPHFVSVAVYWKILHVLGPRIYLALVCYVNELLFRLELLITYALLHLAFIHSVYLFFFYVPVSS